MSGTYYAGVHFPLVFMNNGVDVNLRLIARNYDGSLSQGTAFIFIFISELDPSNTLSFPHQAGDTQLRASNGILNLKGLTIFRQGLMRVIAHSQNYPLAMGNIRYSLPGGRTRGKQQLVFEGQQTSIRNRTDQSVADARTRSGTVGTSVTATASVAPGGVGGSVSSTGSVSATQGSSQTRSSGGAVYGTQPGRHFELTQTTAN